VQNSPVEKNEQSLNSEDTSKLSQLVHDCCIAMMNMQAASLHFDMSAHQPRSPPSPQDDPTPDSSSPLGVEHAPATSVPDRLQSRECLQDSDLQNSVEKLLETAVQR
jgi:hypothetical protein